MGLHLKMKLTKTKAMKFIRAGRVGSSRYLNHSWCAPLKYVDKFSFLGLLILHNDRSFTSHINKGRKKALGCKKYYRQIATPICLNCCATPGSRSRSVGMVRRQPNKVGFSRRKLRIAKPAEGVVFETQVRIAPLSAKWARIFLCQ